jgi:hypothetical protein
MSRSVPTPLSVLKKDSDISKDYQALSFAFLIQITAFLTQIRVVPIIPAHPINTDIKSSPSQLIIAIWL